MNCMGKVHDSKANLSAHQTLLFGDFDPIVCDERWFVAPVKGIAERPNDIGMVKLVG